MRRAEEEERVGRIANPSYVRSFGDGRRIANPTYVRSMIAMSAGYITGGIGK